ncbi:MAG: acyl-CoA thioesterase [Syntrophaceae bacterium]|nr:acyl-CoA thioesterase [Syntrophaceae bacterium]
MTAKTVQNSSAVMAQVMNPQDANPAGNVHGGVIMKLIDTVAGVVAMRHAGSMAVTASIDRLDFYHPVFVGNLVTMRASLNFVGRTSMEVGVRVESEDVCTGEIRHTSTAYLTFVALDKNNRPQPLPELILETAVEERRNREAKIRRESRLAEKTREKESQRKPEHI